MESAAAYMRTSSATNVGDDKDSEHRQREGIAAFAKQAGFQIVTEHYDAGVSGEDSLETRPGFSALLDAIEENSVRNVIVEHADRFARKVYTQEAGIMALQERGVVLWDAHGNNLTETDDELKVAMRQMAGVFAQLEKTRLVKKLAHGREKKRRETGRCEGRKSLAETKPDTVAEARRLYRRRKGKRRSLRQIATMLAAEGHLNSKSRPYDPKQVARMVSG